jgi:simple sugar transport system permease protein
MKSYVKAIAVKNIFFEFLRTFLAALIAALIALIIIFFTSDMPQEAIRVLLFSPFHSSYAFGRLVTEAVPLIFTGVAVCIMMKCGQFNMFVEGAFFAGGLFGAVIAARFPLPPFLLILAALVLPAALSGAVGYIPAKLKAHLRVNEFVSSLMMNFIVYWVCMYLFTYHFSDRDYSSLATPLIPDRAKLPFLSIDNEVSASILLALAVAGLAWVFLYRTKWGYAIRMTGENAEFAHYSGINTKSAIVCSQVIGSMLAGFGGAAFILGNFYRFNWSSLPNYGFDGFIIAIIARKNPLAVPLVALFLGYIRSGAMEMSRLTDVPNEVVYIIQAVMIILIAAQTFISGIRQRKIKKAAMRRRSEGKEKQIA